MATDDVASTDLDDLRDLVAAARSGDLDAFDEIVRRTHVEVYTLATRLMANREDAHDVVQEAYIRAWKGIEGFRGDARFTTWMHRITANVAYTHLRRRRRRRVDSLDDLLVDPAETRTEALPEPSAERTAESAELLARISDALEELPPKLRAVVLLKDVYGFEHAEIAEELGISVPAAKVRLHRGRRRLQAALHESGVTEGGAARAV